MSMGLEQVKRPQGSQLAASPTLCTLQGLSRSFLPHSLIQTFSPPWGTLVPWLRLPEPSAAG